MTDVRFVYDPALAAFELAADHPFKPLRLDLTRDLLRACGLLDDAHELTPAAFDEARLERVHDGAYLQVVRRASERGGSPEALRFGLGTGDNPVFPGMHEIVAAVCAATLSAVEEVASGRARRALNLAGGLHHAGRARASGFCVYNDLAVGIEHAVAEHGLRVAYVDLDAHHGDGVQALFYEDPRVLTVSLHESGRYLFPGTGHTYEIGRGPGRGTSVNVPLEPFTEDDSYLACFDAVVPRALAVFRPDLIVLQAGADTHRADPLADLALSLAGQKAAFERVVALADEHCGGRIVATGGGGYDPYRTVPRAWGHLWAALVGGALPERLPEAWRSSWARRAPVPLPERALDPPAPPMPRRDQIEAHNRVAVRRLLGVLEPIWRGEA